MTNKLKLFSAIGLAVTLFLSGLYIGKVYLQDKPKKPVMSQKQDQKCKAVATRVTNPNGSVTESVSFEAVSNQDQKLADMNQKVEFKHSVILLKDQLSYSYKYIKTKLFEISPVGQIREDKSAHIGIQINF